MDDKDLLTALQVMAMLKCSDKHLERITGRSFPEPFMIARCRYWFAKDVEVYLYMLSRGAFNHMPKPTKEELADEM